MIPLVYSTHKIDEYAKEHENGQLGKTEMWYVVDVEHGSELVCGFKNEVTKDQVRAKVNNQNVNKTKKTLFSPKE